MDQTDSMLRLSSASRRGAVVVSRRPLTAISSELPCAFFDISIVVPPMFRLYVNYIPIYFLTQRGARPAMIYKHFQTADPGIILCYQPFKRIASTWICRGKFFMFPVRKRRVMRLPKSSLSAKKRRANAVFQVSTDGIYSAVQLSKIMSAEVAKG